MIFGILMRSNSRRVEDKTRRASSARRAAVIDSRSNQARIPMLKHIEISRWYATRNEGFGGLTPQD